MKYSGTDSSEAFSVKPDGTYLIRGHHLGAFADLAKGTATPEYQAKLIVDSVALSGRPYAEDVLGRSFSDENLVLEGLADTFHQFLELKPGDSVTITVGEKDGICQCCLIGIHCQRGLESQKDRRYAGKFLELAGTLVESGTISPELDDSCAPGPVIARAELVKSVLAHWE